MTQRFPMASYIVLFISCCSLIPAGAGETDDWVELADSKHGFRCSFPTQPEKMQLKDVYGLSCEVNNGEAALSIFALDEKPKSTEEFFKLQRDSQLRGLDAVLLEHTPVVWQGRSGDRFCIVFPHAKFANAYKVAWYCHILEDAQMYRLMWFQTKNRCAARSSGKCGGPARGNA